MKKTSIEREKKRQQAVAREYRKKGYEVILEPGPSALPLFLAGFRPDLLARNENETVVIEIKSQETLSKSRAMVELAELLENRPGWRFELVVTNPREPLISDEVAGLISVEEISDTISKAHKLLESGESYRTSALLLAWIATEAVLRYLAQAEGISLERDQPAYIVKKLFSLGVIGDEEYQLFRQGAQFRNAVVHGFKASNSLSNKDVRRLLGSTKKLLSQVYTSSKSSAAA